MEHITSESGWNPVRIELETETQTETETEERGSGTAYKTVAPSVADLSFFNLFCLPNSEPYPERDLDGWKRIAYRSL